MRFPAGHPTHLAELACSLALPRSQMKSTLYTLFKQCILLGVTYILVNCIHAWVTIQLVLTDHVPTWLAQMESFSVPSAGFMNFLIWFGFVLRGLSMVRYQLLLFVAPFPSSSGPICRISGSRTLLMLVLRWLCAPVSCGADRKRRGAYQEQQQRSQPHLGNTASFHRALIFAFAQQVSQRLAWRLDGPRQAGTASVMCSSVGAAIGLRRSTTGHAFYLLLITFSFNRYSHQPAPRSFVSGASLRLLYSGRSQRHPDSTFNTVIVNSQPVAD